MTADEKTPAGIPSDIKVAFSLAGEQRDHVRAVAEAVRADMVTGAPSLLFGPGAPGARSPLVLRHGRRFTGIELKQQYFDVAQRNITSARIQGVMDLVDLVQPEPEDGFSLERETTFDGAHLSDDYKERLKGS